MRLEQLEYVVQIANGNSISDAAQSLHTSQQNISKAIKQLEDELQMQIFTRSNLGTFLTEEGERVYRTAVDVLQRIASLQEACVGQSAAHLLRGNLRITSTCCLISELTEVFWRMQQQYPQIKIFLDSKEYIDPAVIYEDFAQDRFDLICLNIGRDALQNYLNLREFCDIYLLRKESLRVFMSKNSPLVNQKTISLKTLSQLPMVGLVSDGQEVPFIKNLMAQRNLSAKIVFSCTTSQAAVEYISNGHAYLLGTNYLMRSSQSFHNKYIRSMPLKEKIVIYHLMIVPNSKQSSPLIQIFLQLFQAVHLQELALIDIAEEL